MHKRSYSVTFETHVAYYQKCQVIHISNVFVNNVQHCWLFSISDKYERNETKQGENENFVLGSKDSRLQTT